MDPLLLGALALAVLIVIVGALGFWDRAKNDLYVGLISLVGAVALLLVAAFFVASDDSPLKWTVMGGIAALYLFKSVWSFRRWRLRPSRD